MPLRARNQLVVDHLHIVGAAASQMAARVTQVARDDLVSAGAYALVRAADRFDGSLGVPFGAFARGRIDWALRDELRSMDWAPRDVRSRVKEVAGVRERLTASLRREPTIEEVAAETGRPVKEVRDALAAADRRVVSLDALEPSTLAWSGHLPDELAIAEERDAFLRRAVDALPERKRWIIRAVYFDERTVTDIATELGVSHAAVSQQRAEAVRMLKDALQLHERPADVPDPVRSSRSSPAVVDAYLARVAVAGSRGRRRSTHSAPTP